MALVPCPECGTQISTAAAACPKCGAPRQAAPQVVLKGAPKRTNPWMVIGWIVLLILLLPLATCFVAIGGGAVSDYEKRVGEVSAGAQ